jgi:glycerol uptake facilitator-like aquaporin
VLIQILAPISGASFNPVVTLVDLIQNRTSLLTFIQYAFAQTAGAITGAVLANAMFSLPLLEASTKVRSGGNLYIGEMVATAGLILIINLLIAQEKLTLIPAIVASWIGSAYFFTSSTSFANPAVTIGRAFSDSFAGIAPECVLKFIAAQLLGALIGLGLTKVLTHDK